MRTKLSLEPTRRSLIMTGLGAAVAFLLCCAVVLIGVSQIRSAMAELSQTQAEVEDGRQIAQRLQQSQVRCLQAQQDLRYLEKSVATRAYIPTLLKQLEGMGQSVSLKVVAVRPVADPLRQAAAQQAPPPGQKQDGQEAKPAPKPAKPPYEGQRIDINVEGSYANALSFLRRLTTFPKVLTVNSVEMGPGGGGAGRRTMNRDALEIKFNITAFVLEEAKPAAAAAAVRPPETPATSAAKA